MSRAPRLSALLAWAALTLCAASALAFDSLASRLPKNAVLSAIFGSSQARARVKDGPLLGYGHERTRLLDDGKLRVERSRRYTKVLHPETKRRVVLPEAWHVRSRMLVASDLRLLESDTRVDFRPSVDDALDGYRLTEESPELFEIDRVRVVATAGGTRLTRTTSLRGETVERDTYDYPQDAIPLEIVGMALAAAVERRVERFDFDLLIPGGTTHGVRAVVHRTRDATAFAEGYRVPKKGLRRTEEMAVVEMRLSSPVKYLFFPHKFFMVYASAEPRRLLALWGGDPDEHMQAFRIE